MQNKLQTLVVPFHSANAQTAYKEVLVNEETLKKLADAGLNLLPNPELIDAKFIGKLYLRWDCFYGFSDDERAYNEGKKAHNTITSILNITF